MPTPLAVSFSTCSVRNTSTLSAAQDISTSIQKISFSLYWIFLLPLRFTPAIKRDIDHTNLYLYSYINFPKNVTFTLGGSGDFFEGGDTDENQFNPKFGITWNPFPGYDAARRCIQGLQENADYEPDP